MLTPSVHEQQTLTLKEGFPHASRSSVGVGPTQLLDGAEPAGGRTGGLHDLAGAVRRSCPPTRAAARQGKLRIPEARNVIPGFSYMSEGRDDHAGKARSLTSQPFTRRTT